MILLGIDTATRVGSVGLVRVAPDGGPAGPPEPGRIAEDAAILAEVTRDSGLGHGSELLPLIDECLATAGVTHDDVACIAVSLGPGSFTGLRVALATAKGLALGGGTQLVGVPTLIALAATALVGWGGEEDEPGTVVAPCLDARKGEVYGATFTVRDPVWIDPLPRLERTSDDAAFAPEAFHDAIAARAVDERRIVLLGDGCARYPREIAERLAGSARVLSLELRPPSGAAVARAGAGMLLGRGPDDRAELVPWYARESEAEIMRARRNAEMASR